MIVKKLHGCLIWWCGYDLFGICSQVIVNYPLFQEPVQDENDIIKFCEYSGLPVALDETIGSIQENTLEKLAKYSHPGIVAVVSDTEFSFL